MDGKPEGDDTDAGLSAKADSLVAILRLFLDPPADELSAVVPDDERHGPAGRENGRDDAVGALVRNSVDLGHARKYVCDCPLRPAVVSLVVHLAATVNHRILLEALHDRTDF